MEEEEAAAEAEAEPESAETEAESAVAMWSAVAEPIRVFIPDSPNVQQATRKVLKRRPTQQGASFTQPLINKLVQLSIIGVVSTLFFSFTKVAARPYLDTNLNRTPVSLSPRLSERDKAAAAAAEPSGHGSRNLFLELLVAVPYFVIRAGADDVGLVVQADHRGRPSAASLGDRAVRIRPVCASDKTTAGKLFYENWL